MLAGKRRYQDVEKELPPRTRKEPVPGDNPLKRPYPPHRTDIQIIDTLLLDIPKDIPSDFCERDKRIKIKPRGVLFFHVLDIQNVMLSKKDFIPGASFCIYLEYECQGTIKCSYPISSFTKSKIRIDHYAHFSAEISETTNDENNDFIIHVYAFQNPEKHWLIGSQLLHLFNFVRDIHGISTVKIQDDLSYYAGRVTFEFAWAYGSFGYGYSDQLLNIKNPIAESVCHSMFPRIAPSPDDLIHNKFRIRTPKCLRTVNIHSLLVRTPLRAKCKTVNYHRKGRNTTIKNLSMSKRKREYDKESKSIIFRRVRFARGRPVFVALNLDIYQKFMQPDFSLAYGEFICLRNRRERLEYLTRTVDGRLRDRYESDATRLFYPIKDAKDCRDDLSMKKPLACPPGYIEHKLHPKSCPPKLAVKLTEKDEEFISSITSAPRFSGYLAHVFGYSNPKSENVRLTQKEKCEFKVDPHAFLGGEHADEDVTFMQSIGHQLARCWYGFLLGFIKVWEFIFPSTHSSHHHHAHNEILVPEISVTLPSPADSTTEFYAHCTQEKVFPTPDELTLVKRQTIQLVRVARKLNMDGEEDEDQWLTDAENSSEDIRGTATTTTTRMRDVRPLEHVEKGKIGASQTTTTAASKSRKSFIGSKSKSS